MLILNEGERDHALPQTNEPDYVDSSREPSTVRSSGLGVGYDRVGEREG